MLMLQATRRVVTHLAFAPDGRGLVTAGGAGVHWWPDPVGDPDPKLLSKHATWWVAVTAAGDRVVAAELDGGARVFGFADKWGGRTLLRSVRPLHVAVSPTAPLLVTQETSGHDLLTGWHVEARKPFDVNWTVVSGETSLSDLHFGADGSWFMYRDFGRPNRRKKFSNWVVFLDAATGAETRAIEMPDDDDWFASAVSPDGDWLATLHTTRSWVDVRRLADRGPAVCRIERDSERHFTAVAIHPSGRFLAIAGNDGTVRLYDTTTWRVAQAFEWDIGKPRCVAFSRDGTLGAVGSDKGYVVIWDVDL
jgi:WD40 repeat protein